MKKVAVTGAGGFLGNHICRLLINQGYEVTGLYFQSALALEGLSLKTVQGDIQDPTVLDELLAGIEVVIHCVAITKMDERYDRLKGVNVDAVTTLVNACLRHNVKRIIKVSSIQIYRQEPLDEALDELRELVHETGSDYDRAQIDGDIEALKGVEQGLEVVITAVAGLLGPHDFRPTVSGTMIQKMGLGEMLVLKSSGYNWVDARDVAQGIINSMEKGRNGETYILAGDWISLEALGSLAEGITGKKAVSRTIPVWFLRMLIPLFAVISIVSGKPALYSKVRLQAALSNNRRISSGKAQKELGYAPRPIQETLRDTLSWFQKR